MRRRITRALAAAAAAGVTLTTFGLSAAGASASSAKQEARAAVALGPTIYTRNMAGYSATGRDFRYIQALITVPDWHPTGLEPHEYIQLASNDHWVRIGITYFVHNGHGVWATFIASQNNYLFPVHFYYPRQALRPGDGVFFSIYYYQAGDELHFVIIPPPHRGGPDYFNIPAHGPIFTQADALDDWTYTCGHPPFCQPAPLPPFVNSFRINQFFQGAITTYNGDRGSFVGPWTTSKVAATSNGQPFPVGALRVSPGYLWSDGMIANGALRPYDAFGVWTRH